MSATPPDGPRLQAGDGTAPASAWALLAAEDLRALAWLHREERSPQVLQSLLESGFPATLSLVAPEQAEVQAMAQALVELEGATGSSASCSADDLAADYADIYLSHALRASPCESVWRDEDHLLLQGPTFAVRNFYRRHGVQVADWRQMSDDHLCHELDFVALLLQRGEPREAARFMQAHLMTWLPDFSERVAMRAATAFYAALAVLTRACCEACQAQLPKVTPLPPLRPSATANQCG
jgi:TorA maturation chaperone TorD